MSQDTGARQLLTDRRPGEQRLPASRLPRTLLLPLRGVRSCAALPGYRGLVWGARASGSQCGICSNLAERTPLRNAGCLAGSPRALSASVPPSPPALYRPVSMGAQSGSQACLCSHPFFLRFALPPLVPIPAPGKPGQAPETESGFLSVPVCGQEGLVSWRRSPPGSYRVPAC